MRKYLLAGGVILGIVLVLAGIKVHQFRSMMAAGKAFVMPPETVSSAKVEKVRWERSLAAVGTVSAVQGVLLKTEVPGTVKAIRFESGAVAHQGDVLVELDASAEEAQLRSAEAKAEWARLNLARATDLNTQQVLSNADLETAQSQARQSSSDVDNFRVAVSKKTIRAPFTGRLGIREVQLGQYVEAGAPIVPLQSVDPVHVDFSLPEQDAGDVREGMKVRASTDARPDRVFDGTLTAVSPEVDPSTRNMKLQATFEGTNGELLPGMFVRVEIVLDRTFEPLVVPVTAVMRAPYGDSVFVVTEQPGQNGAPPSKHVRMTTVTTGETRGDLVVIEKGVEEGQEVASSGVFKLRNDMAVVINNDLAPAAEAQPNPKNS